MTFGLDMQPEGLYLHARVTGARTPDNIASVAKQVLAACIEQQLEGVLLDIREFEGRISIFDAFMIPASLFPSLKQTGMLKRLALLEAKERSERAAFFESVARKGGYNIRAFSELDNAIAWLTEEAEADSKA